MNPRSSRHQAPANRFALHVIAVQPLLATEEVLPHVRHATLHDRLSLGIPTTGSVDGESPVGGVLLERPLEHGIVPIRLRDGRLQVVNDHQFGYAAEKRPGVLQPFDQVRQLLRVGGVHVLVPTERQHHDERPQVLPARPGRGGHQPQPPEVHLRGLARQGIRQAHRAAAVLVEPAVLHREPVQRAVRHPHALPLELLMHLREAQSPLLARARRQPRPDAFLVRQQQPLRIARPAIGPRPVLAVHLARQRLAHLSARPPPQRFRRRHVPTDRLARMPGHPSDGRPRLAATDALQHVPDLPHAHLSVRHRPQPPIRVIAPTMARNEHR